MEEAIEKDSVEELLIEHEDMDNAIECNYQCGGCGKMYDNEDTANKHIEKEHMEEQQCSKCTTYEDEEKVLKQLLKEEDEILTSIKDVSENIITKNVALDKENKRLKLALKQSEVEKNNLKKEIENQREALDETLK